MWEVRSRVSNWIRSCLYSNGFPWAVLVIMLIFSTGLWHYSESIFINLSLDRFKSRVENQKALIINQLNNYRLLLQSAASFMAMNDAANYINWPTYVSALKREKSLSGMLSMGFISVDASGNPILNEQVSYSISRSILLTTLTQAKESGKLTLSPRLLQNTMNKDKSDFLFIFPVYRNNTITDSTETSGQSAVGFVYISFQVTSFMRTVSDNEQELDIELFDGIAAPEHLMFSSRNIAVTPRYASRKELIIGGRIWTLHILSKPEFEASTVNYLPIVIRFGGIGLGLLLFFLLFLNVERQRTIQELIAKSEQKHTDI